MIFSLFVVFVDLTDKVIGFLVEPILGTHVAKEWDERCEEAYARMDAAQRNMNHEEENDSRIGLNLHHSLHIRVIFSTYEMVTIFSYK